MRESIIILFLCACVCASAHDAHERQATHARYDSIYQGTLVKLDLANSIIEPIRSKGGLQNYEAAVSVRLIEVLYPTLEIGAAWHKLDMSSSYQGGGGFARIGLDYNPLRKYKKQPHALLIGLRVATAGQQHAGNNRWDAWGEVLAGCNVNVASDFYMGWTIRFKILMTRSAKEGAYLPEYVPGYGDRSDTGYGVNYYLGWRF